MEDIKQLKQAIEVLGDLLIKERSQGNIKEALDRAKRIRELSEKLVNLEDSTESRNLLAHSITQQKELERIYETLQQKIKEEHVDQEVLEQVKEMLEGAQSFTKSGDVSFISGELNEALFFYENAHEFNYLAVKLFSNYETLRELERIQRKLAFLHSEMAEYNKAQNLYKINVEVCKDLLKEIESEEVYHDLAYNLSSYAELVYPDDPAMGLELYNESLRYRKEAVERFNTLEALDHLIISLIALARMMQKSGDNDKALEYYMECLPAIEKFLSMDKDNMKMRQVLMAVADQIDQLTE